MSMIAFPDYYYAPVFFKPVSMQCLFLDVRYGQELKRNINFLKFIKARGLDVRYYSTNKRIEEFEVSDIFDQESDPNELAFQVEQPPETILKPKVYDDFYVQHHWVVTDRYFYPHGFRHVGSSRHALLYSCQLKGVGRNALTHRGDYVHSSGGYSFFHAFSSLVNNLYLDDQTPFGALPVWAIYLYKRDEDMVDVHAPSVQVRDAHCIRLAHFDPGSHLFDPTLSDLIIKHLRERFDTDDLATLKSNLVKQYLAYVTKNIGLATVIPENFLFDGRTIDTDHFDVSVSKSLVLGLSFRLAATTDIEELTKKSSIELLDYLSVHCSGFFSSSVHKIAAAWTMHASILDQVFSQKYNLEENLDYFRQVLLANLNPRDLATVIVMEVVNQIRIPRMDFAVTQVDWSDLILENLKKLHLIDLRWEGEVSTIVLKIKLSQDPEAKLLNHFIKKQLVLFSTEFSTNSASSNFKAIKKFYRQFTAELFR